MEEPAVRELLEVMKQHNSPGREDLLAMCQQIAGLEQQLNSALEELSVMRRELAQARESPVKRALQKIVAGLEKTTNGLRERLDGLKEKVVEGCKKTLAACRPWRIRRSFCISGPLWRGSAGNWKKILPLTIRRYPLSRRPARNTTRPEGT